MKTGLGEKGLKGRAGKGRAGKSDIIDRGRRENRIGSGNSRMQSLESKVLKLKVI